MPWKVIRKITCALVTECDSLGSNGSPKCMFVTRLLNKYSMMVKCTTQKVKKVIDACFDVSGKCSQMCTLSVLDMKESTKLQLLFEDLMS